MSDSRITETMHYLVTGGCGFIGSHLAHQLVAAGHDVTILDNFSTGRKEKAPAQATVMEADVRDAQAVAAAMNGIDGVFHLAAVASVERCTRAWAESHATNLTGTVHIFEAAAKIARTPSIVYASSAAVYGDAPTTPLHEQVVPHPLSAYGADKLACELHGRVAAMVHGVKNAAIRPFNVYGPGQQKGSPYSGVITLFFERVQAGEPFFIHGDGMQMRDFIYVEDVSAHFMAAMQWLEKQPDAVHERFNACTGIPVTIRDLAQTVQTVSGKQVGTEHQPARTGDIRTSWGDPSHASSTLGARAATALADGLSLTWKHVAS